jgi:hypothetical protein
MKLTHVFALALSLTALTSTSALAKEVLWGRCYTQPSRFCPLEVREGDCEVSFLYDENRPSKQKFRAEFKGGSRCTASRMIPEYFGKARAYTYYSAAKAAACTTCE